MAQQGEAAGYYQQQQPQAQGYSQYQQPSGFPPQNYQYGQGPPQSYPPPETQYDSKPQPGYSQNPPMYNSENFVPPTSSDQKFEDTFKVKPKWNDLWAYIALIATFLGFVAVSGLSLYRYSRYIGFNSGGGIYGAANDFSLNSNTVILFVFVLAMAFVLSWAYFLAARAFTKQFIWLTGILNCALAVGTAIYYLYRRLWGAGIVFAIFAVFAILCFISWIKRIPFAVVCLQQSQDIARMKRVHVFAVSAIGSIIALLFGAWYAITLSAIYVAYMPSHSGANENPACSLGGCSSGRVIGLLVFITFAMYWISEWIKNVIHTTIAGTYGSWYFTAGKPGGIPKGATTGAFKRSVTYSGGSIAFGSLIVAIINMLRQACSIARSQSAGDGNIVGYIFFFILSCLIGLLDWAVTFINKYAFIHIALYGKKYLAAAKDTWTMMKDRGLDALINDCLIGPVISMGSLFVGYCCALLAYLYLEFTKPAYNDGRTFTPVIMAFSFVIGLQMCQILLQPVVSGVETIFVAMGWDPEICAREHPEFWQKLIRVYPHVQDVIHA